jgi:hypothetical protein
MQSENGKCCLAIIGVAAGAVVALLGAGEVVAPSIRRGGAAA